MKKILFIVSLFISFIAIGQTDDSTRYLKYTNSYGIRHARGWFDSVLHVPYVDTIVRPARPGMLVMRPADKKFYGWNGTLWSQLGTGSGGSGSGITSLGQGYGVNIVNDSTYDVDSSVILNIDRFYRTIDSIIAVVNAGTIDSIVGTSNITIDFTNRRIPVIGLADTVYNFIFEAPIQANVYGDTVYVYLDSTGNGDYSIAHHSFGYYLGVFLTTAQADNIYIRYDSAIGKFVDTLYSRSGNNIDTLFSSKNGVENAFYKTYKKCDELLEGGLVSLSHDLTYDITAAIYRIGCVDYNSLSDSVILSPADPDSARIDLIVLDTNGDVVVIEGEVAENPVEPQYDPELYLLLTTVYIPAAATEPLGVTVITVYDENLGSPTEFTATNGAGLTVNWGNTTNPYHLTKDGLVSSWTNGSNRTISFTSSTNLTSSDYSLLKMFIDLTGNMNNNSSINVRFYYNNTAVTGTITLSALQGFSKTDVGYQNITIPMPVFFSTTFNRIDIIMTGAGPGLYIDWVQLQGGISNGSTDYVTNIYRNPGSTQVYKVINGIASPAFTDSVGTSGTGTTEYVVSGLGIRVDSSARVYTVNVDTFLISTRAWRDKLADSLGAIIATKGTGTVTSLTQGYGILNSTNPITTTGTQRIDTFAISTRAWRDKLADSLGVVIATKQAQLNGTGYVKMSGTTASYQSNTQLTADVNTFTQTLKGAVPAPTTLNGYFLKDDGTWAAGGSGVTTMAAIGATPNANGASISGSTLTLQPASASFGGVVTTAAQTFAGDKTINTGSRFIVNGNNTSNSNISAGALELQSFAVNNNWLSDNLYYNGSAFVRRAAGYASRINFGGGTMSLGLSGTSTAGSAVSFDYNYQFGQNGKVQVLNNAGSFIPWEFNTNSSNSNVKIGSLNFQSFAVNNCFISDNAYYNGSAFQRIATGAVSVFYLGAGFTVGTLPSSTSGTTQTLLDNRFEVKLNGQTAIADNVTNAAMTHDASGVFEVQSTTRGSIAFPKMTQTQRDAISSPTVGLMVHNTDNKNVSQYNGVNWTADVVISSAGTLTLKYGADYIFTGTTTTWTLPAISGSVYGRLNIIKIKNRGSGAITLNTSTGNTLYTTSAVSTITINAGAACELLPDGTYNLVQYNL